MADHRDLETIICGISSLLRGPRVWGFSGSKSKLERFRNEIRRLNNNIEKPKNRKQNSNDSNNNNNNNNNNKIKNT